MKALLHASPEEKRGMIPSVWSGAELGSLMDDPCRLPEVPTRGVRCRLFRKFALHKQMQELFFVLQGLMSESWTKAAVNQLKPPSHPQADIPRVCSTSVLKEGPRTSNDIGKSTSYVTD